MKKKENIYAEVNKWRCELQNYHEIIEFDTLETWYDIYQS